MESKKNHTQESIALGAGLIGQAKGDIASARRAAGEAFEWLCTIDHTYKPEQAQAVPVSDDYRQRMEQQVRVLTEGREKAEKMVQKYEQELRELRAQLAQVCDMNTKASHRVSELEDELADHRGELKASAMRIDLAKSTPAPVAKPAPAQLVQPVTNIAPPRTSNDEFAHLPPAMREFARQAAAARKLEID